MKLMIIRSSRLGDISYKKHMTKVKSVCEKKGPFVVRLEVEKTAPKVGDGSTVVVRGRRGFLMCGGSCILCGSALTRKLWQ